MDDFLKGTGFISIHPSICLSVSRGTMRNSQRLRGSKGYKARGPQRASKGIQAQNTSLALWALFSRNLIASKILALFFPNFAGAQWLTSNNICTAFSPRSFSIHRSLSPVTAKASTKNIKSQYQVSQPSRLVGWTIYPSLQQVSCLFATQPFWTYDSYQLWYI